MLPLSSIRVPHNRLTFGEEEVQAVTEVIRSGYWAGGPRLKALEEALSACAGVPYAVGVSSGLSALRLALKGLGVEEGDDVIVPAYSCTALANAVLALGATPVPADVREGDWNIDPQSVRDLVTPRTKAIVMVHMFGAPGPIEELQTLSLPIVEDCAHAFGVDIGGVPLGGRSEAAILSFYATKLLGAGEGGAVLTGNEDIARIVRSFRDYGDQPMHAGRLNDKMTDIEATLALCQLQRVDAMVEKRATLAQRYQERLLPLAERTGAFRLPDCSQKRVWYRYAIEMLAIDAQSAVEALCARGIHAEPPAEDWREGEAVKLPVTSRAYHRLVSIPLYPTLLPEEQEAVCAALEDIVQ